MSGRHFLPLFASAAAIAYTPELKNCLSVNNFFTKTGLEVKTSQVHFQSREKHILVQNMPKNHSDSQLHPFMVELKKLIPEKLTAVIDYYEILIAILQAKMPQHITFNDDERARIAMAAVTIKNTYGQSLFAKIKHLVQPDTILKWFRKLKAAHNTYKKPGRPPLLSNLYHVCLWIRFPKNSIFQCHCNC